MGMGVSSWEPLACLLKRLASFCRRSMQCPCYPAECMFHHTAGSDVLNEHHSMLDCPLESLLVHFVQHTSAAICLLLGQERASHQVLVAKPKQGHGTAGVCVAARSLKGYGPMGPRLHK